MNFTNVDAMGRQYRDGSEIYSSAVKRCDAVIGDIIKVLKRNGLWQDTGVVLTTQHGYMRNSQVLSSKVWVASTEKIQFKGTTLDIVPTIYKMYGLNLDLFKPKLPGKGLIY